MYFRIKRAGGWGGSAGDGRVNRRRQDHGGDGGLETGAQSNWWKQQM